MDPRSDAPGATAPQLTFDTVVELLEILDRSDLPTRLEFRDGPLRLKVERGTNAPVAVAAAPAPVAAPAAPGAPADPTPAAPAPAGAVATVDADLPGTPVEAPIAGVFYQAPSPGATPFVTVGQQVSADDTIGIVEVMKLMNTVRAGVAGTVVEVCANDGDLVEFGQALVRIEAGA